MVLSPARSDPTVRIPDLPRSVRLDHACQHASPSHRPAEYANLVQFFPACLARPPNNSQFPPPVFGEHSTGNQAHLPRTPARLFFFSCTHTPVPLCKTTILPDLTFAKSQVAYSSCMTAPTDIFDRPLNPGRQGKKQARQKTTISTRD